MQHLTISLDDFISYNLGVEHYEQELQSECFQSSYYRDD